MAVTAVQSWKGAESSGDGERITLHQFPILGCHVILIELLSGPKTMLLYNLKYFNSELGDLVAVTPACPPNQTTAARFTNLAMLIFVV